MTVREALDRLLRVTAALLRFEGGLAFTPPPPREPETRAGLSDETQVREPWLRQFHAAADQVRAAVSANPMEVIAALTKLVAAPDYDMDAPDAGVIGTGPTVERLRRDVVALHNCLASVQLDSRIQEVLTYLASLADGTADDPVVDMPWIVETLEPPSQTREQAIRDYWATSKLTEADFTGPVPPPDPFASLSPLTQASLHVGADIEDLRTIFGLFS
jgi:hypothetical protein